MKTLYFDLSMGAAGDMLTAALLELTENPEETLGRLNELGIPGVRFDAEKQERKGVSGTYMRVTVQGEEEDGHHHHHHHSTLTDIQGILDHLRASAAVKEQAKAVYERIARAEAEVHGRPGAQVHFHEVGALDAVADVSAVCFLLEQLGADAILASPVHTGYGQVHCAHGLLDVPAPATALLLQGIPGEKGDVEGELCTPTGAALVGRFVSRYGDCPRGRLIRQGTGLGKKDFSRPNCLRVFLLET